MYRLACLPLILVLTACGSTNQYLNERTQVVEYYRIYDLKTSASKQSVAKAASDGLRKNTNSIREASPISTSGKPPIEPARIQLVNPFQGTKFSALATAGGPAGVRVANCEGAVWTAKAVREVPGSNNLDLTACLFPYVDGYHLASYAVFQKVEGGLYQISRDAAYAIAGTPEEWVEKTFADMARSVRVQTDAKISLVESQPEVSGTPWLDSGDASP